ncbi:DUF2569 family protein [Paenibacillus baimaensis]|uniref:DUF2569 family protein n=1 Tax=Paenibacillus baimaensis TaxID=2982185 RepID=UPI0038CD3159
MRIENKVQEQYPRSIGGWLILYLGLIIISTALYVWGLIREIPIIYNTFEYTNGYELFISLVLLMGTFIKLITSIIILMMFVSKKSSAVKIIILLELFCILIRLLGIGNITMYNNFPSQYFVSVLFIAISLAWIIYFKKSNRVKETFMI